MFEWNYDRQMSSKMASPTPNVQNEAEVKNRHGRSGPSPNQTERHSKQGYKRIFKALHSNNLTAEDVYM